MDQQIFLPHMIYCHSHQCGSESLGRKMVGIHVFADDTYDSLHQPPDDVFPANASGTPVFHKLQKNLCGEFHNFLHTKCVDVAVSGSVRENHRLTVIPFLMKNLILTQHSVKFMVCSCYFLQRNFPHCKSFLLLSKIYVTVQPAELLQIYLAQMLSINTR